jgi:hypothetical protein
MQTEIDKMMTLLTNEGVHVCGTTEDFYGGRDENSGENGIWISGESTPELFDYYREYWNDTFGVEPKLNKIAEDNGWYFEWYDPGTMMMWRD